MRRVSYNMPKRGMRPKTRLEAIEKVIVSGHFEFLYLKFACDLVLSRCNNRMTKTLAYDIYISHAFVAYVHMILHVTCSWNLHNSL